MSSTDRITKENAASLTTTVFGWWRKDKPLEVSYRYWRDVHAITVARVPGLYQYRLFAIDPPLPDIATDPATIDFCHGIAEIMFRSEADQQTFGNSRIITDFIHKDEQNLCDRNVTMTAIDQNARTIVDRTGEMQSGKPQFPTFAIGVQQQQTTSVEFRQQLSNQIEAWSNHSEILRLRLHLLEPFDPSQNSPCVSHDWAPEQHYQAWIELVMRDAEQLPQLLQQANQIIRGLHVFPVTESYTLVAQGTLTPIALRGFPAISAIAEAEFDLQASPELLELLYGKYRHD